MSTGLVITAPSSLLQFCKQLEAMQEQLDRAQKFLVDQYAKSPLAKKRAAKNNLTEATNAALALTRKTLHEVAADNTTSKTAATPLLICSPPALAQHFAANAPNQLAAHRLNTGSMRALIEMR